MPDQESGYGPEGLLAAIAVKELSSRPREIRVAMLRRTAGSVGLVVALVGVVVMLAWFLDVDRVKRLGVGLASMKFGTAAEFAGIGIGLFIASREDKAASRRILLALSGIGGSYAALAILEYAAGFDAGIDNPFGLDERAVDFPGRMSEATGIGILLIWLAIAAMAGSRVRLSQVLALGCLSVGVVTLLGYAYGVEALYSFGPFSSTAVHTGVALTVVGVGVLLLRSGEGYMSVITGNTAGGIIVRRMTPIAVLTPMIVGAVVVLGLGDAYTGEVALALFATIVATFGGGMILFGGSRLRRVDLRRAGAEATLQVAQDAIESRDRMAAELSASERRTREILDSAAEAYVATDVEGRTVEWNQAATDMFGWTREEMLGQRVRDVVVNPTESIRVRQVIQVDATDEEIPAGSILGRHVPFVGRRKSGETIDIESTTWRLGAGAERTHHSLMMDVTARRRAERELQRALDDIGDFSAAMAHDLKGPLTVVKGYSQMLETKIEDDVLAQLSGRITQAADRGMSLIDDILAFAEIGAQQRDQRRVELTDLAIEIAANERASAERSASVSVAPLPDVLGDEALLRRLFGNLIGNALKYVPEDRVPEVSVTAELDAPNGTFDVRVCDNGNPLPVEDREDIFTMFSRGTNTEGREGTGVGLAICQRVAELHGGTILVEASDAGNCFVVTLPLAVAGETPARDDGFAR